MKIQTYITDLSNDRGTIHPSCSFDLTEISTHQINLLFDVINQNPLVKTSGDSAVEEIFFLDEAGLAEEETKIADEEINPYPWDYDFKIKTPSFTPMSNLSDEEIVEFLIAVLNYGFTSMDLKFKFDAKEILKKFEDDKKDKAEAKQKFKSASTSGKLYDVRFLNTYLGPINSIRGMTLDLLEVTSYKGLDSKYVSTLVPESLIDVAETKKKIDVFPLPEIKSGQGFPKDNIPKYWGRFKDQKTDGKIQVQGRTKKHVIETLALLDGKNKLSAKN